MWGVRAKEGFSPEENLERQVLELGCSLRAAEQLGSLCELCEPRPFLTGITVLSPGNRVFVLRTGFWVLGLVLLKLDLQR